MIGQVFRIHPVVGIARVGNSDDYVIAPETMAGSPASQGSPLYGGLPIRAGTDSDPIRSSDVRDAHGALKRQAARFRIFRYPELKEESWPRGDGVEITIGSVVDGRTVKDIIWTVHVANKKANTFVLVEDGPWQGIAGYGERPGIAGYTVSRLPPIRNPGESPGAPQPADKIAVLNQPSRVRRLTIDPGPRTISGASAARVRFDRKTTASCYDARSARVIALERYPKSFPDDAFAQIDAPAGAIDTLGELETDAGGRLIVLGGYGRAAGWRVAGAAPPLEHDVNNDQWFDDTSDGPVSATLVFDDDSRSPVHGGWVTTTDPSFAPQILNVVSLWDDVYDSWVRGLDLAPEIYRDDAGGYQHSYRPTFDDQLAPIFQSASLQQWTTNMSAAGRSAHAEIAAITAADDPTKPGRVSLLPVFRNPFDPPSNDTRRMPLHLGDAGEAFLTLRKTQYFFLQRWSEGSEHYRAGSGPALDPGEMLDKATMVNCLGGRFSPGIDLTFIMREPAIYITPWRTSGAGPFRIRPKPLAYESASAEKPLLTGGYVPRHVESEGLEPGDLSKFMAIPWHTDYNSCATHPPSPNPPGNRTLFWSWPAQRPVAVYASADVSPGDAPGKPAASLGPQRWSVRGEGTDSPMPENWGRYQKPANMLENWHRLGVVMQAPAIDGAAAPLPPDWYLEVESQLVDSPPTPVIPFPNLATELDPESALGLDPRELFHKLMNVSENQDVLPDARAFVDAWLRWSEAFSLDRAAAPADVLFFDWSEQAFKDRLELIYQELTDDANKSDAGGARQTIRTREDMIERIIQMAPFNLIDGAWLRNVGTAGPIDEVRALLYSVCMDEMGDGVVSRNHSNIYLDLCHSLGYYPPPVDSRDFAFDPRFLKSAFTVPAFQLAISQFSDEYFPELLGMTTYLEWEVNDTKPTRDLMVHFGIDPHFFVMHIGIDNAVNGHGRRAVDAVCLYLQNMRAMGGQAAVNAAWRRIWNGFVAFGNIGTFGEDLRRMVGAKPTLRDQMLAMIGRKAGYGSRNHQMHTVGPDRIDDWFADPPGFLDALRKYGWITPGDWKNSRMNALMNFQTGPMFRVFTDDEIALWEKYTLSLAAPPSEGPRPAIPPARAMAALIDQLRPVQQGVPGHQDRMLLDAAGAGHSLAWWFERPTRELMEALASPANDVIVPGKPEISRFCTELIAPMGPMGSVFDLPAERPNTGTCRDVVDLWISAGCPLPAVQSLSLRLNTAPDKHDLHPTGRIYGMGTVH